MTKSAVSLGSTIVRNADLPTTPVDGETVILNLKTNNYVGLDEIGSRIWSAIDQPVAVEALCATLAAHYRADLAVVQGDAVAFLQDMVDEGLVQVVAD